MNYSVGNDYIITIIGHNLATVVAFKKCASFIKCITRIDRTTVADAQDLGLVMQVYKLLEHSSNYSDTSSSWRYSKDEAADFNTNIVNNNNFKSFK